MTTGRYQSRITAHTDPFAVQVLSITHLARQQPAPEVWREARHLYSREDLLKHRCGCRCPFGRFTSCTQGGSKYNVRQSQAAPFPSYPTQVARCTISLTCYCGAPPILVCVAQFAERQHTLQAFVDHFAFLQITQWYSSCVPTTTAAALPTSQPYPYGSTPPFCMQASKASTLTSDQRTMLTTLFELLDDNKDGKLVSNHHLKPCHAQHSLT